MPSCSCWKANSSRTSAGSPLSTPRWTPLPAPSTPAPSSPTRPAGCCPASTPRFPSAPLRWSTPCWCRRTPCCKPPRDLWSIRSIPRTNTPWPASRPSSWEKFSATNFCWTAGLNRAPPPWRRASTKYGRTARSPPASELGVPSPVLPADEKGASAQPDQSAPAASGSTH